MATPKPKRKTVADLKTNILNPALTSTYECTFVFPDLVEKWINRKSGIGNGINRDKKSNLTIACREASLPGSSLATHESLSDFTGVRERHAYRRQYEDVASFSFYVDTSYDSIYLFENWMNFIVNQDASDSALSNSNYFYRVNFFNEYKTDIYIRKFEKDYRRRNLEYKFIDAYPSSINSMPVSYDASQLLLCTVNFNFSRFIIKSPDGYTTPSEVNKQELPEPQEKSSAINDAQPFEYKSSNITDRYYNNFGDNTQNSTNSADFTDGSNTGPFGDAQA